MLLLICSKLCQWFASGPLAQGIRPVGLTTGGNLHIWADLKLSLASLLPTGMCMLFVWWYRNDNSDATGDTTIAASISGTLLSFLITFRSGQSYNRWFEGRGAFGRIHAGCRALSLYVSGAVSKMENNGMSDEAQLLATDTRNLLLGLIRSVILHLRGVKDNSSLKEYLSVLPEWTEEQAFAQSPGYNQVCTTQACRPMILFKLLIARLAELNAQAPDGTRPDTASDYRMVLNEYSDMVAAYNSADKLVNTPSPNLFMYLLLWVYFFFNYYTFPITMASVAHEDYWLGAVVTYCVSYFFGLLVMVALDMDNPFDDGMIDLPLEKYEAGLKKDMDMILILDLNPDIEDINPLAMKQDIEVNKKRH